MEQKYQVSSASKRRKLNIKTGKSDIQDNKVIASVSNYEQTSEIFNLPTELFEYIFSYLPLRDLVSVGKTCMLFNEVAGQHFRMSYPGVRCFYVYNNKLIKNYNGVIFNSFIPFIQNIGFNNIYNLKNFIRNHNNFRHLKAISFCCSTDLYQLEFKGLKKMDQVEYLRISSSSDTKNIENFFNMFPNLKRLTLILYECRHHSEIEWIIRKYPALTHLEFYSNHKIAIATILRSNANIRVFETTANVLGNSRSSFLSAGVSLDELRVHFVSSITKRTYFVWIFQILKELQANGFYKQLRIDFLRYKVDEFIVSELGQLKSLSSLLCSYVKQPITLSALSELREIRFRDSNKLENLELLASRLESLEYIYFFLAKMTDLMPFFNRAKKMKKMGVYKFHDDEHFNGSKKCIDLSVLNKTRKQLCDATQITLYVAEDVYLATKAIGETNLELINLTHLDSYCLDNPFDEDFMLQKMQLIDGRPLL